MRFSKLASNRIRYCLVKSSKYKIYFEAQCPKCFEKRMRKGKDEFNTRYSTYSTTGQIFSIFLCNREHVTAGVPAIIVAGTASIDVDMPLLDIDGAVWSTF